MLHTHQILTVAEVSKMDRSGQTLFWTIIGSLATVAGLLIGLVQCSASGTPSAVSSTSSDAPIAQTTTGPVAAPTTTGRVSAAARSATPGGPPMVYLADMAPSGDLAQFVTSGLVQFHGRTYPKSINFMCGDQSSDTPGTYSLNGSATTFVATVGVENNWPTSYLVGGSVVGDGRTLKTFTVSVLKPETIRVNVTNVQLLQLECSYAVDTASNGDTFNVQLDWGDAHVTERG